MPTIPSHDIFHYQNKCSWLLTRTSCSTGRSSLQPYNLAQRYGEKNKAISNYVTYLAGLQSVPGRRETSCRGNRHFSGSSIIISLGNLRTLDFVAYYIWPATVQPVRTRDSNGVSRINLLFLQIHSLEVNERATQPCCNEDTGLRSGTVRYWIFRLRQNMK